MLTEQMSGFAEQSNKSKKCEDISGESLLDSADQPVATAIFKASIASSRPCFNPDYQSIKLICWEATF